MSEIKTCRICFDDENQEGLIAPCGCKGSAGFVHKTCLNNWLKCNKSTNHYYECNECKHKYRRVNSPEQESHVNFEIVSFSLTFILGSVLFLMLLMFTCGISVFVCSILLFILYVITLSIINFHDSCYSWVVIIIFLSILGSSRKVKTFIIDSWLIIGFCYLMSKYNERWDRLEKCINANYMSNHNHKMYDYFTKTYIDGII